MKITDAMREAVPAPLYPCAKRARCGTIRWLADELNWYRDGFYCWSCLDDFPSERDDDEDHTITIGPDLADVLAQAPAPAAVPVEAPPLRYLGDTP